jgi:hypothetical protein
MGEMKSLQEIAFKSFEQEVGCLGGIGENNVLSSVL